MATLQKTGGFRDPKNWGILGNSRTLETRPWEDRKSGNRGDPLGMVPVRGRRPRVS